MNQQALQYMREDIEANRQAYCEMACCDGESTEKEWMTIILDKHFEVYNNE